MEGGREGRGRSAEDESTHAQMMSKNPT